MPFDLSGTLDALEVLVERDHLRRAGVPWDEAVWLTDRTGRTLEEVREGMDLGGGGATR